MKNPLEGITLADRYQIYLIMSRISVAVRIPEALHKLLEAYMSNTRSSKTEVVINALAQYLSATEEVSLNQRVKALEYQVSQLSAGAQPDLYPGEVGREN